MSVSASVLLLELSVSDSGTIHTSLILCTEQVNTTSVLGQTATTDSQGTLIAKAISIIKNTIIFQYINVIIVLPIAADNSINSRTVNITNSNYNNYFVKIVILYNCDFYTH